MFIFCTSTSVYFSLSYYFILNKMKVDFLNMQAHEHDIFWLCIFHNFSFYSMPIPLIIMFLYGSFYICYFLFEQWRRRSERERQKRQQHHGIHNRKEIERKRMAEQFANRLCKHVMMNSFFFFSNIICALFILHTHRNVIYCCQSAWVLPRRCVCICMPVPRRNEKVGKEKVNIKHYCIYFSYFHFK